MKFLAEYKNTIIADYKGVSNGVDPIKVAIIGSKSYEWRNDCGGFFPCSSHRHVAVCDWLTF